ncbi:MAG: LuxR family transcriptional regulator, partial [Acidimicrobiales bacterium]
PAAAEVRLSYTGLFDILAGTDLNDIEELATPQRRALDAALLREPIDDSSPEPRAVAAGFLSVLDGLAARAPTLLAIDDVQWLDEPTRRLVHHASRRCSGPVAMLIAERGDDATDPDAQIGPIGPERRVVIPLGPLSLGALHEVVKLRTGVSLRWPAMVQITEASAGNPYFAVELARSVDPGSARVDVLPVSLLATLRDRLAPLGPATVAALGVVSALADPRVELAARALEGGDVEDVLAPARAAGVVDVAGGRVRFTHPLLATAVYSEIAPSARRSLHGRLSRIVDDAEERARHLALASVVADDVTTAALDEAAALARRRGAPDTAAELLERAISLGAADPRRRIDAADDHYRAGSLTRARQLLEEVIPELAPGALRARALARLGTVRFEVDASPEASEILERAVAENEGDLDLRASTAMELCWVLFHEGRCRDGLPYAALAVDDAERLGHDGLLAEALAVRAAVGFLLGHGSDEAAIARALQLEDPDRPTEVHNWPSYIAARLCWWTHRLDEARSAFAAVRKRCIDHGGESDLRFMDWWTVQAECAAGDIASAEALVDEHVERARRSGTDHGAASA